MDSCRHYIQYPYVRSMDTIAIDQTQQLHALTQKNHETELAKIEGQGFLKRLKAIFSS